MFENEIINPAKDETDKLISLIKESKGHIMLSDEFKIQFNYDDGRGFSITIFPSDRDGTGIDIKFDPYDMSKCSGVVEVFKEAGRNVENQIFMQDGKKFFCTDKAPKKPYRLENEIDDFAYIVDFNGIIWIKDHVRFVCPDRDYGICYSDFCLRGCIDYIAVNFGREELKIVLDFIPEHVESGDNLYKSHTSLL